MDPEDESTAYLKYLNDPATTNNFLLNGNVELTDGFPFSEIGTTDWPSESFPILLNTSLTSDNNDDAQTTDSVQLFSKEDVSTNDVKGEGRVPNQAAILTYENETNLIDYEGEQNDEMYINFSPIVKENANGNKEIYLTANDINNDSSIIHLLNTDGSIITIDKSILSSLNLPNPEPEQCTNNTYDTYYTSVLAQKCKICSFLCETEGDIKIHLEEKHAELFVKPSKTPKANGQTSLLKSNQEPEKKYTIYLCSLCRQAFQDKSEIREHMIDKHQLAASNKEVKVNEEKIASPAESRKASLRTLSNCLVKQQEKARKRVKCTIKGCHIRFSSDELREKHEQCHVGDNKALFKCLECEENFTMWRICSNHMWNIHKLDIGLLVCTMCNKYKTSSKVKLLNHMAIHDDEKPFLCDQCGKGYRTLSQLKNHEVLHNKNATNAPNWLKTRKCELCERNFANSKSYKKHIQAVHENFKPFICNICGHKAARKAMLELHLRQHTGEKPHKCPYCDYRTGDHNCLRRHTMIHKGERKYKCPYCTYTAIQSIAYKNHIRKRHPHENGEYSCTYCTYTSVNPDNFAAHLKRHEITMKEYGIHRDVGDYNSSVPNEVEIDDDETQNFIFTSDITVEETVDTGGITIPAGLEL